MSLYRVTFPDGVVLHLEADRESDAVVRVQRVFRGERFAIRLEASSEGRARLGAPPFLPSGQRPC